MPAESEFPIVEHAIQLNYVGVRDIVFHSDRLPSALDETALSGPTFSVGRSDYDAEKKFIHVINRVEFSHPEAKTFVFRIELVSQFSVDDAEFPAEKVNDWADRASFYIIFPYLREEVYALSIRVGMKPILLPLVQLPTYKVEKISVPQSPPIGARVADPVGK